MKISIFNAYKFVILYNLRFYLQIVDFSQGINKDFTIILHIKKLNIFTYSDKFVTKAPKHSA